jgi:methionyl-tRNA formyltransferase
VVAYGQILRPAILALPPLGCLNLHPSLLPKLRGASPIQAAIREGLTESGVSIMLMNERMDAGPVLAQARGPVFEDDTAATLGDRLARLGAELLVDTIPRWQAGVIVPSPQDDAAATYCRPLRKEDANVDWGRPAEEIARICRAQTPWPGCQSWWTGKLVRFLSVQPWPGWSGSAPPGTVLALADPASRQPRLAVATGQGALEVRVLQLPGRRQLTAEEFLRGQPRFVGARLIGAPDSLSSADR